VLGTLLCFRCHFPLVVPEKAGPEQLGMQIGASTVAWQSGVPLVFDDCFVHSVWNRTARERVVLLFDIWWVGWLVLCTLPICG
jgi:aspartyl/asparaginyl beta-hydroxylase (cupin superfamily)